jgi:hypothetical protein
MSTTVSPSRSTTDPRDCAQLLARRPAAAAASASRTPSEPVVAAAVDLGHGRHMPKTWFITGASRGFGREWAIAALERGDTVAATARDTATLDDLVERFGDKILPIRLDVTDREADFAAVRRRTSTSAGSTSSSTTPATASSA